MKTVLTGVKPTHRAHIGNYLGAIRPAVALSKEPEVQAYLFIADYHALTTVHDPKELQQMTYDLAATWLACGLDPEKSVIYRQSDIPEIMELAWILSCFTPKGFMNRAHAYKARVQENQQKGQSDLDAGVSMGLYSYPVLMSADILAFDTDEVPVGEDQVQHVEFARDIADKFNHVFGKVIRPPKFVVKKDAKLIPGLDGRKMSKSYGNHIPLFVEEKKLRSLIMKIKTDSTAPSEPKDPDQSLIMDLYKEFAATGDVEALRLRYASGIGWGEAKEALFVSMNQTLSEPRLVYNKWMNDLAGLERILQKGAERARAKANPVLSRVRQAIGLRAL